LTITVRTSSAHIFICCLLFYYSKNLNNETNIESFGITFEIKLNN